MPKRVLSESAQATVELVAAIPLALVVVFAGWQLVVVGHTWWKLQEATRIAARTVHVAEQRGERAGGVRRARATTTRLLASSPSGTRELQARRDGTVSVSVRAPLVGVFMSTV